MRKMNKKNLILSVIALLLVMLVSVGATYSWIEDIAKVELNTTDSEGKNIPLTVGKNIAGVYEVTSDNAYINLGTAWTTNSTTNKREINSTVVRTEDSKTINGSKGYFYESGDFHLTPCIGDGQNFYFHKGASNYIAGNHDNANVDYISSTIEISSPTAKTEFWFDEDSIDFDLYNGSTQVTNADNYIRVAIIVDGIKKIYSNEGSGTSNNKGYDTLDNGSRATKHDISKFESYTHYADEENALNQSDTRGVNGNTLFTVGKGETKSVTFRVWLEDNSAVANVDKANLKMRIISSWAFTRDITIEDKTTNSKEASWLVGNNSTDKIFLAIPAAKVNDTWESGVSYWPVALSTTTHEATVQNIPAVYNGEKMFLYRCRNEWDGTIDSGNGFNAKVNDGLVKNGMLVDEGGVNAWNFWRTNLPDSFSDEKYSVYGGSLDNYIHDIYHYKFSTEIDQTNQGYGTWDGVSTVEFHSTDITLKGSNTKLAAPAADLSNPKLIVEDYSDYFTSGYVYYSIMHCYNVSNGYWRIYLPTPSTKITFHYCADSKTGSGNGYYGHDRTFGYRVQTDATNVYKTETINLDNGDYGSYERTATQNIFTTNNADQHYDYWRFSGVWSEGSTDDEIATIDSGAPSADGLYLYGDLEANGGSGNAKFSNGLNNGSKVTIPITKTGSNYCIRLCEVSSGSSTYYGTGANSQTVNVSNYSNGSYNVDSNYSTKSVNFVFNKTGYFTVTFNSKSNNSISFNYSFTESL